MAHPNRFFADIDLPSSGTCLVTLSQQDSHHLLKVLRAEIGRQLTVVDRKASRAYRAILISNEQPCLLKVIGAVEVAPARAAVSTLAFALCRGKKNDLVCEKAVELGVNRILFFQAERSVVRLKTDQDRLDRQIRLAKIAETAAAQSGKDYCPEVVIHSSLGSLLQTLPPRAENHRFFCAALSEQAKPLREIEPPKTAVGLLIGPEGDLSEDEYATLTETGFEMITLGRYILRAETAAVAGIAMIEALWGQPR